MPQENVQRREEVAHGQPGILIFVERYKANNSARAKAIIRLKNPFGIHMRKECHKIAAPHRNNGAITEKSVPCSNKLKIHAYAALCRSRGRMRD